MKYSALALAGLCFAGAAYAQNFNGNGGPMGITLAPALGYVNMSPVTVANLPTCNAATLGYRAFVSDATAPAFNTVLAGAGAVFVEAHCTYATAGTFRWVGY